MQRVLEPAEIQSLDRCAIPRVRLPERATIFSARAARLRKLADESPISGYMRLMASLADVQQAELREVSAAMPGSKSVAFAQRHSKPIAPVSANDCDPQWRDILMRLLESVHTNEVTSPALTRVIEALRIMDARQLDALADAVLLQRFHEVQPATAPFVMAALQVIWTDIACRIDPRDVPRLDTPGTCPVCGSPPVASVVRVGGQFQGYRYLQCGLCSSEWHLVRVKCSNCDSTRGIAYYSIDGDGGTLKAESCDECRTYRKIGYQEKDYEFEPLADDLASLTLDLLMTEAGYKRTSPNPLLWPEVPSDE